MDPSSVQFRQEIADGRRYVTIVMPVSVFEPDGFRRDIACEGDSARRMILRFVFSAVSAVVNRLGHPGMSALLMDMLPEVQRRRG